MNTPAMHTPAMNDGSGPEPAPVDTAVGPRRTARARQVGLALSLFVAPWCFVLANTGESIIGMRGGDDLTPRGALTIAAAYPELERWASFAALIGSLLMVPASLGLMRLVRLGAARLGLVAGAMMVAAYVCYFALVFQGFTPLAMVAAAGGSTSHDAAVLQAQLNEPLTIWVYLTFAIGNIVGTFLMGLALRRSRAVPSWAAYAVLGWPVLHVIGLPWFEVVGAVSQAVGMAVAALALLGRTAAEAAGEPAPYELLRK
jgi:hypothetical protein